MRTPASLRRSGLQEARCLSARRPTPASKTLGGARGGRRVQDEDCTFDDSALWRDCCWISNLDGGHRLPSVGAVGNTRRVLAL